MVSHTKRKVGLKFAGELGSPIFFYACNVMSEEDIAVSAGNIAF